MGRLQGCCLRLDANGVAVERVPNGLDSVLRFQWGGDVNHLTSKRSSIVPF